MQQSNQTYYNYLPINYKTIILIDALWLQNWKMSIEDGFTFCALIFFKLEYLSQIHRYVVKNIRGNHLVISQVLYIKMCEYIIVLLTLAQFSG